jgi:hypothetical protein
MKDCLPAGVGGVYHAKQDGSGLEECLLVFTPVSLQKECSLQMVPDRSSNPDGDAPIISEIVWTGIVHSLRGKEVSDGLIMIGGGSVMGLLVSWLLQLVSQSFQIYCSEESMCVSGKQCSHQL